MPGPRLLDKKLVNAELATQRKRDIEAGVAIAGKVDAVRETLGREEAELDAFRSQTIKRVREEIDGEIAIRDSLIRENDQRREERIRLMAPIDLTEAWNEVKAGKDEIAQWRETLSQQSIELLAEKGAVAEESARLERQDRESARIAELADRTLLEAERRLEVADTALTSAEASAQEILRTAHQRDNHLKVREEDATNREIELSKREVATSAHEKDLSERETKLRTNIDTFMRAQNYIKNKK